MKELEVKIPVDDLDQVENRLNSLGAKLIGFKEEHDYYIDTRPCIDLVLADSALRIRVSKDVLLGEERGELTFKGARERHSIAKVRREITIDVGDPIGLLNIFKELGFKVLAVISKKRKIYQYKGFKVYLDDVNSLGKFVEVEVVYKGDEGLEHFIDQELLKIVDELGLPKKFIKKSYLELILSNDTR